MGTIKETMTQLSVFRYEKSVLPQLLRIVQNLSEKIY